MNELEKIDQYPCEVQKITKEKTYINALGKMLGSGGFTNLMKDAKMATDIFGETTEIQKIKEQIALEKQINQYKKVRPNSRKIA